MMQNNTTGTRRTGFQLMWHRRVGLTSFACLLVGTAWLSSVVLPGLQRSNDKAGTPITTSGIGELNVLSLLGSKPTPEAAATPGTASSSTAPAIGTVEITVVNAPVGSALQLLLASARFSCSSDPSVKGVVTYSTVGSPKPFWEVLGRVIGASPAPGVHVAAVWDSYRVLPRDIKLTPMRDYSPQPAPEPIPVPLSEGRVTHRMVGYVSLKPGDEQLAVKAALLETRIPGIPAQWRMLRAGDTFQSGSPATDMDAIVRITDVAADHLVMDGGVNKVLKVPLGVVGVVDVFGFSAGMPDSSRERLLSDDRDSRSGNGWNQ